MPQRVPVSGPNGGGTENGRIEVRAQAGPEDLIPGYLSGRQKDLIALANSAETGDLEVARIIGHGMKGSGAGYGFPAISKIGREIEQCAKAGNADGVLRQVVVLDDYLQRVQIVS